MNAKLTATAIALMLGMATPLALAGTAAAQETVVDVTFSDGTVQQFPLSQAAALCGVAEEEIVDAACDSELASENADEFLDELEDDGEANENSAKEFAPGQLKGEGESARDYAPGQTKGDGESAKDHAPGQQKKN